MKAEDKELLTRDLCARLQYGAKATTTANGWNGIYTITGYANDRIYLDCPVYDKGDDEWLVESVKPYLRPIKSITDAEWADCVRSSNIPYDGDEQHCIVTALMADARTRWYDKHMFDHRGLLPKGLAIEMPKEMYKS